MKNITEIVFGDSLYNEMINSNFFNKNNIIKFNVPFSIIDLSSVDNDIVKLNQDFCQLICSELNYKISNAYSLNFVDIELEGAIKNNHKIRIWTTHKQADSYLMFLYICNYFSKFDYDVYVLFSEQYDKDCYSPACMNEKELEDLLKSEHKISKNKIIEYAIEWEKIKQENSNMRVIENGKIKSVSFDYYNKIILDKLSKLGEVKVSTLIVNLMNEYHFADIVFTYLVYRLIKVNEIMILKRGKRLWNSIVTINSRLF